MSRRAPGLLPSLVVGLAAVGCGPPPAPEEEVSKEVAVTYQSEPIQALEVPPDLDPLLVDLGGRLFHDVRLSADASLSCASCHAIPLGGDDGRPASIGIGGAVGPINAPTVLNSGFNIAQFWDGRAETLEEQVNGPVTHPEEMGSTWEGVVGRLRAVPAYQRDFDQAFADGVTEANVRASIAEYERSLVTVDSPFDRWLGGDEDALADEALEGYGLFKSLGCVACHQGRNVGGNLFQTFGVMGDYFADRGDITEVDLGRFRVTGNPRDRHRFRVPALRNVALTAPYFHDGTAATLDEAVQTMARYQLGRRIETSEVSAIVAFFESLTGELPSVEEYLP